jgi:hypothetical protein
MVEGEDIHFSRKGVLNWWAQDELAELIRDTMISHLKEGPMPPLESKDALSKVMQDFVNASRSVQDEYRAWFDANVRVSLPVIITLPIFTGDKEYRGHIKARVPLYDGNLESVFYRIFQKLLKLTGNFSVKTTSDDTYDVEVVGEGKSNFHIGQEVQDESIYWVYEAENRDGFEGLGSLFGAENEVER